MAFIGTVKVTAARSSQIKLSGHVRVFQSLLRGVAAGHHFDRLAAVVFEFGEQSEFFCWREAVARRVGNDCNALAFANPAYRVAQRCPAVRHKAGFAFGQKTAEHFVRVFAYAGFDQKTGEVGAGNQIRVAGVGERTFKTAVYADLGQTGGHVLGAIMSAAACGFQTGHQAWVIDIKTQTDDMHGVTGEGDRNFGTTQVTHAQGFGRSGSALLAADFVMVGQRPKFYPVGMRAGGEFLGRERAIRDDGVAMQVGVKYVHVLILGGAHVFHMQFEFALTLPAVEHQTVSQLGASRQGFGATKPDTVDGLSVQFEFER